MTDLVKLTFYDTQDNEVGQYRSEVVPRIDEAVILYDKGTGQTAWRVTAVRYLYPQPGSMSYNAGDRSPFVDLKVIEHLIPFFTT